MTEVQEMHLELVKLQKEIENYLGMGGTSVIFEYSEYEGKTKLDIITVNPKHRESFLFHSVEGLDKIDAMERMVTYVRNFKELEASYTVQWSLKSENDLHTSYFRAKDIPAALDKLYFGRDANTITVFSVVLNPIA